MKAIGQYDADLQMFVQAYKLDAQRLAFLRWMADMGRLEHNPLSRPTGQLASIIPCPWRHEDDDRGYGSIVYFN